MSDTTSVSNRRAPESEYVQTMYDGLLSKLPEGYTAFRWQQTAVSRFHYRQSKRALARALCAVPAQVNRVLEVGGGSGAWTGFFAGRTKRLDFVDISESMIAEARGALESFKNITYIHADIMAWEPQEKAYELAISLRNIEYMQDKRSVLNRIAGALVSGGRLILSTKNPEFDWNGYFTNKPLHGGQVSLKELQSLLVESGFVVERVYPAIIGKKIKYAAARVFWDMLQAVVLRLPPYAMPLFLLRRISESFLVVARRP